jgi:RepB DNA-primase from phage plasmid/CHC2 zinc finger
MTTEKIPQDNALALLLAAISGNEPTGSYLEIRPLTIGTFQPAAEERCWIPVRDLEQAKQRITALAPSRHVYVGAAPRVRKGGTADDIARVWNLWADLDTTESVNRLPAFRPRPSIVIQTRPGRLQAWWPLRQPLTPAEAKRGNQQLALALGADRQAVDAARILRPPLTLNHKTDPPALVVCVRCELDVFTSEQIIGKLPDPTNRAPAQHQADRTYDALDQIPASEYVPQLTGHELGRDLKLACPFHQDRTPSLHCYQDPEQGWYCYGCGAGGSVVDFAAALYGIDPRGAGFHEIRQRLASDLLGKAAA